MVCRLAPLFALLCLISSTARGEPSAPTAADFAEASDPCSGLRVAVHPLSLVVNTLRVSFEWPLAGHWAAQVTPLLFLHSINALGGRSILRHTNGVGAELAGRYYPGKRVQAGLYHGPMLGYVRFLDAGDSSGLSDVRLVELQAVHPLLGTDLGYQIGYQARFGERGVFDVAFGLSAISVYILAKSESVGVAVAGLLWASTLGVGVVF